LLEIIILTKKTFVNGLCVVLAGTSEINTPVKSYETQKIQTSLFWQQHIVEQWFLSGKAAATDKSLFW
jgi:hypothetical protein